MSNKYDATNEDDFPPLAAEQNNKNTDINMEEGGRSPSGRSMRLRQNKNNNNNNNNKDKGEQQREDYTQQKKSRSNGTTPDRVNNSGMDTTAASMEELNIDRAGMEDTIMQTPTRAGIDNSFATTSKVLDEALRKAEEDGDSNKNNNNDTNVGGGNMDTEEEEKKNKGDSKHSRGGNQGGRGRGRGGRVLGRGHRGRDQRARDQEQAAAEKPTRSSSADDATSGKSRASTKRARSRSAIRMKSTPMTEEQKAKHKDKKGARTSFEPSTVFKEKSKSGGMSKSGRKKTKKNSTPPPPQKEVIVDSDESEGSESVEPPKETFFEEVQMQLEATEEGSNKTLCDSSKTLMQWLLKEGAAKDKTFCLMDPTDDEKRVYSGSDLGDWDDFMDMYTAQYQSVEKYNVNLRQGSRLTMFYTVKVGCTLSEDKMLTKVRMKTANVKRKEGKITLKSKAMQEFDTRRHIILSGVSTDVELKWFTKFIGNELEKSRKSMLRNNVDRFELAVNTSVVPDFIVEMDWVANTPYEERDKNDKFNSWSKQALQVTCKTEDLEFLTAIFFYMMGTNRFKQLFGEYTRVDINCGADAQVADRVDLRDKVEWHAAVRNNNGKVVFKDLQYPDQLMELELEDDDVGERENVFRTGREVLYKMKYEGVRMWQTVLLNRKGQWVGYFSEGKGAEERVKKAANWGSEFGGNLMYYMADRGVSRDSITAFLNKILTNKGARGAFASKRMDGMVYSPEGASRQQQMNDAANSSWFDVTLGMSDKRKKEYEASLEAQKARAGMERAAVKPGDRDALNFENESVGGASKAGSMNFSKAGDSATLGSTKFVVESESEEYSSDDPFGEDTSWDSGNGEGGKFEGLGSAVAEIERIRGVGGKGGQNVEDVLMEEETDEKVDPKDVDMEEEVWSGAEVDGSGGFRSSSNSPQPNSPPRHSSVQLGFSKGERFIYTGKGEPYTMGVVVEVHHDGDLLPYYEVDIGGNIKQIEHGGMKVLPPFTFQCGDDVFVALNSNRHLHKAKVHSYQGDPLCPTKYKLIYSDSPGIPSGPVDPSKLYPAIQDGMELPEKVAVDYLVQTFPHLRERERESDEDDSVKTAVQNEPNPGAVQEQTNATGNSELMEQSTDQRRSEEDEQQQRHTSHQEPVDMSAEDSSKGHPREVSGQGDGAENAGGDLNPD